MGELLSGSSFFCIALTIGAYYTGFRGQRKWKKAVFNPILIGAVSSMSLTLAGLITSVIFSFVFL